MIKIEVCSKDHMTKVRADSNQNKDHRNMISGESHVIFEEIFTCKLKSTVTELGGSKCVASSQGSIVFFT